MSAVLLDVAIWAGVAVVTVLFVLGLWAAVHRSSFRAGPGRLIASWWALHLVYGPRWPALARRHGLAASDRVDERRRQPRDGQPSRPTAPTVDLVRLRSVRRDPGRDRLRLVLPSGITPDDVRQVSNSLGHALRVRSCVVRDDRPGQLWLDVRRRDALATLLPAEPSRTGHFRTPGDLLDAVVVGRDEDGRAWQAAIRGSHTLIAGTTGSGKSSLLWALVCGLLPAVEAGMLRLTWLDPKGGMEADAARPIADVVDRVDAMADHLDGLVTELDARASGLAGTARLHQATSTSPHELIVIDELATITALADAKTARRVEAALGALLSRGRAVGFTVITTTVDPGKDVVRWRGLHANRVAFRLDEPIQVDMVLGDGARHRGARCDEIPLAQAGVAYVRVDGHPDPVRVRATYFDDDTIRQRIAAAATSTTTAVALVQADEPEPRSVPECEQTTTEPQEVLR